MRTIALIVMIYKAIPKIGFAERTPVTVYQSVSNGLIQVDGCLSRWSFSSGWMFGIYRLMPVNQGVNVALNRGSPQRHIIARDIFGSSLKSCSKKREETFRSLPSVLPEVFSALT